MRQIRVVVLGVVACCIGFTAFSQVEHIKFRDIEVNGNVSKFVSELKLLGYVIDEVKDDSTLVTFEGEFAGKGCKLLVVSTKNTKIVYKVVVLFPKQSNWRDLKSEYKSFKEQLTIKYGKPSNVYEKFGSPYYDGDGYELQALSKGKCVYATTWDVKTGSVYITIDKFASLSIHYENEINSSIDTEEKNKKIQDDL